MLCHLALSYPLVYHIHIMQTYLGVLSKEYVQFYPKILLILFHRVFDFMNKFVHFISKFNRLLGQVSQSVLYIVVVIILLDVIDSDNQSKVFYCFFFVGVIMLVILFILNVILIVLTMILIFMRKINDDDSYNNDKETDSWSALFMVSSILIPFLAWFTLIRNSTTGNNSLCVLIWFLQWLLLFNSYFYNAFLKQYS